MAASQGSDPGDRTADPLPDWVLRLCGGFRLYRCGDNLAHRLTPRARSLVAHLALQPDAAVAKSTLAARLWPDTRDAQARTNLRTLLHQLHARVPDLYDRLRVSRDLVELPAGPDLDVDVWRYDALACAARRSAGALAPSLRAELEDAALRLAPPLLPECYDDWIVAHRERLDTVRRDILDLLAATADDHRNPGDALRYARWRMLDDPF